jgi:hypothetical protein
MRVCIYHNVARDDHGHMINFDGYEPGQPLVLVFEADVDRGEEVPVSALAEQFWAACNLDPDMLTGRMAAIAEAYRERRLRSLSFPGRSSCCLSLCCAGRTRVLPVVQRDRGDV